MEDDNKTLMDFRQLQEMNAQRQSGEQSEDSNLSEILANKPMPVLNPGGLRATAADWNKEYYDNQQLDYTQQAAEAGFGTDRRDRQIDLTALADEEHALEDYRAQAQSNASKLFNGTAKFVPTALTTFADGIVGTIAGAFNTTGYLGKSINEGERITGRELFNSFVDNPISQKLLDVQDYFEKVFPNYYTDEERNDNGQWWKHINANMIGDQFIKNLGFTAGAMAAGMVNSGLTQSLRTGGGKAARNIIKAGAAASAGDDAAEQGLRRLALNRGNNAAMQREATQAARNFRRLGLLDQVAGGIGGAVGEARIEALHAAREFYDDALQSLDSQYSMFEQEVEDDLYDEHPEWFDIVDRQDEYGTVIPEPQLVNPDGLAEKERRMNNAAQRYNERREYLDKLGTRVANQVFVLNIPLLAFDNVFEFGKLFGGGFNTMRKALRRVRGPVGQAVGRGSVAGAVASGFANALVEGFEEINQKVISEGSKDIGEKNMASFYNDGKDAEEINNFGERLGSMLQSGVDVYADPSSWQEFAIGALTGSISYYTGKDANGKARWAGGIGATIKDRLDDMRENAALAKKLNDYVNTDSFQNLVHSYTRHAKYSDVMADAADVGNKFVYHTAKDKDLINLVATFQKAGRIADLKEFINRFSAVGDADIAEIRTALSKEDGSGITDDSTDAEVKAFIKRRTDEMQETVNSYMQAYDNISSRAPIGTDEDALVEYAYTAAMLDKFDDRFFSIWEGEDGKGGVRARLRAFFEAEAANAVDNEGHALTEEAQRAFVEKEMQGAESLLRGQDVINRRQGEVLDSLSSSQLIKALNSIKGKLSKKGVQVDETLISDIEDMTKLITARKNYYRALADPAHNIISEFASKKKSNEKAREEATRVVEERRAASVPDPTSIAELRSMLKDPSLSADERAKRESDMMAKDNPVVKLYKRMKETTEAFKSSARKRSTSKGTVADARALFDWVLAQDEVTDIPSLYDFALPEMMDANVFNQILKQYNPYESLSVATPFSIGEDDEIDLAAFERRYAEAKKLYEQVVNETKRGNVVAGKQDEYGQPVSTAAPAPAPARPAPSIPDPFPVPAATPASAPVSPAPAPAAPISEAATSFTPESAPAPAPAAQPEPALAAPEPAPAAVPPAPAQNPNAKNPLPVIDEPILNPTQDDTLKADQQQRDSYARDERYVEKQGRAAKPQATDGKDRDIKGKVLYEETAIPEKALEDMQASREGEVVSVLRDFDAVAYQKLGEQQRTGKPVRGAGDYRGLFDFLRRNDAFGWVNRGRLREGSDITFTIFPENTFSSGRTDTNGNPVKTVFMMYGDHLVGVLRDAGSTYAGKEIYGHSALHKDIQTEYEKWKKTHNPETDTFRFSKRSRVWRVRKGRLQFRDSGNEQDLKATNGFDRHAPIVFKTSRLGWVPLMNISNQGLSASEIKDISQTDKPSGLYYLAKNADGTYIPVRLTLAHFNDAEAPGQEDSPIYQAVYKTLRDMFADPVHQDISTAEKKKASNDAALAAKQQIGKHIYIGNVGFSFGMTDGVLTFRIYTRTLDSEGQVVLNKNGKEDIQIISEMVVENRTPEDLAKAAIDVFKNGKVKDSEGNEHSLNPQIQLDFSDRATVEKSLRSYIDAGYVTVNAYSLNVVGASFYIDPYDPVTRSFIPVFAKARNPQEQASRDSAEAARQKAEADAAVAQQKRDEESAELREILNRRRERMRIVSREDIMNPAVVSPENRTRLVNVFRAVQDAEGILPTVNALQSLMNVLYDLGITTPEIQAAMKQVYKDLKEDGFIVEDLYGKDYNPRSDVEYVVRSVHYPSSVSIVSKVVRPLVKDKNGKVVQRGKIEVMKGDGTRQMLRRRNDVVFEEAGHTYTRVSDGKQLEGVTTMMSNQGVGVNYDEVGNGDPVKRKEILSRAAAKGTAIHEAIQDYDDGLDRAEDGSYTGNKTRSAAVIDPDTGQIVGSVTVTVKNVIDAYRKIGLPVIASEYLVTDGEDFASQIDKVMRVDENTVDLADLKTTSSLHKDALQRQLSTYAYLFERQNPGVKVRNLYGIHVQKNGSVALVQVDRLSDTEVERVLNAERARLAQEQADTTGTSPVAVVDEQAPLAVEDNSEGPVGYEEEDAAAYDDFVDDPSYMSDRQIGRHRGRADLEGEVAWLDKVLPHVSEQNRLHIKRGLIRMSNADGWAHGQVQQGIMTLSEDSAEGTTYHEAFHWVFQYLLDDNERSNVLKEAMKAYGTRDVRALEEKLADDFREWKLTGTTHGTSLAGAFDGRGLFKSIAEFFRRLLAMITGRREWMPYVHAVYQSIDSGKYADRDENISQAGRRSIMVDNAKQALGIVQKYKNPHFTRIIDYKVMPDGSTQIIYELPNGRTLAQQDNPFSEQAIADAVEAIKDLYKHGFGLDLTSGLNSVYYSEEEGFVFSAVMPVQQQSQGETLAEFYALIGKTGLNFKYLSKTAKEQLEAKEMTEDKFDNLSSAEKEHMLRCLGV